MTDERCKICGHWDDPDEMCGCPDRLKAKLIRTLNELGIAHATVFRHELREAEALALVEGAFRAGWLDGHRTGAREPRAEASQRERDWLAFVAKVNQQRAERNP
jgi:hypothetical protein